MTLSAQVLIYFSILFTQFVTQLESIVNQFVRIESSYFANTKKKRNFVQQVFQPTENFRDALDLYV